jgi:hypothetical protein
MSRPDLSRTKAAIEAYDAFDAQFDRMERNQDAVVAWFAELERLGEAVGIAFGLDTADRNSLETCRGCIRPGHRIPGPGEELSFVRRMVAQWEAEKWKA